MAIEIPLSKYGKNRGKYVTIVSDEDKDLADVLWCISSDRRYASRRHNKEYLHRTVLERIIGRSLLSKEFVDHINGDGLDNRRENLRISTNQQNSMNAKLSKRNTTGFKGVSFNKSSNRYISVISKSRKFIHLGYFDTPEEAHEAYCNAAEELFGEFAKFE